MPSSTSPSLLIRLRNPQDHDAWQQFLDVYSPVVRAYCFQRSIQVADADDIVQEIMARLAGAIKSFDYDPAKGLFRAWLGTIAANQIKTFLAKGARRVDAEVASTASFATYEDPDSEWVAIFSERVFTVACHQVRQEVSDVAWKIFEATWIRKEQASQVAKRFGITTHADYVNKSRVLKRMEEEINNIADDFPIP